MVKSYLRYEHLKTFGVVASPTANPVWAPSSSSTTRHTSAGAAVVPANEEVLVWDIKSGELLSRWKDDNCKAEVTIVTQSKTDNDVFAVGYSDGSIRIWDWKTAQLVISFNGHRSAVSALAFDSSGTRLASGGKDASIIVWDLIAEVGLYKLKGHKDQITTVGFLRAPVAEEGEDATMEDAERDEDGWLISTGKDTLLKLWELSTQHCMETHVAHNGECWGMALSPDGKGCITTGNDGELKVWAIDPRGLSAGAAKGDINCLLDRGYLYRSTKDRGVTVTFHPSSSYIATHGTDKNVEIWRIRTEDEIKRLLKRKRKRKAEKAGTKVDTNGVEDLSSATVDDIFVSYVIVRAAGKVRGIDWAIKPGKSSSIQILVSLTSNALELYDIRKPTSSKDKSKESEVPDYKKLYSVELPGHKSDVRSLALSSDDRMLASASSESLKIWNVKTSTCIRTFDCGYSLCCSFLPGDKIVVVGTKTGEIELFDVASSVMIESIKAHEGAIWSLQVHPDGKSLVTGSADKTAKFWNFEVVQEEIPGTKRTTPRLKLVHKRTLKMEDDILAVRYTPNGKHIAVALLDNTVRIFFTDTLKQLHNLYGHKLPVLNIDISSDSKLIATCSADKNVKIWGLDFGDVHKSFFAHSDSIMQVCFERDSHNFFSASKDRLIKYWDGDKFENIQKMEGHHGEVWALAVGRVSEFVVSASHDKSIRIWEQTDDQIFLEEEREKELEELYESTLTASLDDGTAGSAPVGKQTAETLMAGERIMEAIDMGIDDLNLLQAHAEAQARRPGISIAPPQRNPVYVALGNISAETHLANIISKVKASHLQDALLVLPFEKVEKMMRFLDIWAAKEWNIPLTSRILFFLLRTHHRQLVASKTMRPMLDSVRAHLRAALRRQKDEMGFNLAGVRYILRGIHEAANKEFVGESDEITAGVNGTRKRGFGNLS
ncbi:WD40-repeat-containing domain protein [Kalaharituber pfeilii]|nr:WD40-repeat-containing domain protein [Kalaharituber pfeilii]